MQRIARNLREQIAEQIREEIVMGRLQPGHELREVELAQRFAVSRGPVREALQQLAHEGCVTGRPNCGVRVAPAPSDHIRAELVTLRRQLEVFALREVFEDLTDDDFAGWAVTLDRMKAACLVGDMGAIWREDIEFHQRLVARADRCDLLPVWQSINARARRGPVPLSQLNRDRPLRMWEIHNHLLDLMRGNNREAAVRELEDHIFVLI